jgi:Xaa-Pro aminopeptidase
MESFFCPTDVLREKQLDAILLNSQINRFWFTKFNSSAGYCLITFSKVILFADGRYYDAAKVFESPILEVVFQRSFSDVIDYCNRFQLEKIGFEQEHVTFEQ